MHHGAVPDQRMPPAPAPNRRRGCRCRLPKKATPHRRRQAPGLSESVPPSSRRMGGARDLAGAADDAARRTAVVGSVASHGAFGEGYRGEVVDAAAVARLVPVTVLWSNVAVPT